ncbi:sphingomyelin phosphodiesterase [Lentzea guizhouensis]|uniref:Sphingomyelin phosphodiesterase n=1 Tax=Lentzea guizhouensis TaxID=1586287 RepID=A0A1B2HVI3_9PSEU|nr:sphingomyelin phosphodiesterase [Lentzea guizhouensis]ANZ41760.1 sphingomyelin phosphodiesterase [Lentzea guizhouensis]
MRLFTLAAAVALTISAAPVATATPATAAPTTAAPTTAASATAAPAAAPKIATYNVFMLSRNLYPNWGQLARADLIDSTGVLNGQDVVVLQEAFDNAASDRLLANLRDTYPHQTPVLGRGTAGWDVTSGAYRDSTPEDGGAAVLSRWPITTRVQHVYRDACGADWFSNKGFAYVRIEAPAGPLHVIGTHMQAEDSSCTTSPASYRAQQRAEIKAFLAARDIPATEPVYVAGDLNVVRTSTEFTSMVAELGARTPAITGHPFSWDCADNSICRDQYGPEYASEHLDYVLTIQGPALVNETRRVKSPEWTIWSWGRKHTYTDLSDHYPVFAG